MKITEKQFDILMTALNGYYVECVEAQTRCTHVPDPKDIDEVRQLIYKAYNNVSKPVGKIVYDTIEDTNMTDREILEKLKVLASFSTCRDKQVGALAVRHNTIVAGAWNIKDPYCKGDCCHHCCPTHAEHVLDAPADSVVYLTLYPCEQCQRYLYNRGVNMIIVFGEQHKQDIGLVPIRCV